MKYLKLCAALASRFTMPAKQDERLSRLLNQQNEGNLSDDGQNEKGISLARS